jgi:hypothetical protein
VSGTIEALRLSPVRVSSELITSRAAASSRSRATPSSVMIRNR